MRRKNRPDYVRVVDENYVPSQPMPPMHALRDGIPPREFWKCMPLVVQVAWEYRKRFGPQEYREFMKAGVEAGVFIERTVGRWTYYRLAPQSKKK